MRLERCALLLVALALCACKAEPPAPPRVDTLTSNDGNWVLEVEPPLAECALNEPCSFAVRVERVGPRPIRRLQLEVDAAMPDHRHGLNVTPQVSGNASSGYQVEGLLLHMPGYWEIYFDVTEDARTERAQIAVER